MCVNDVPEQAADQDNEIYDVGGDSNSTGVEESLEKFGGDLPWLSDSFPVQLNLFQIRVFFYIRLGEIRALGY